ncbi:hypothetical protein DWUX_2329 [Desulfovibrio diazotrophicus]|nr:hypothetical protein DWUX_2329 [Desulfovibrio diazotrophicus]
MADVVKNITCEFIFFTHARRVECVPRIFSGILLSCLFQARFCAQGEISSL